MTNTADKLALITCSYRPDFHRCRRLCRTVDQYTGDNIEHIVLVPARDVPLFKELGTSRRTIIAVQDLVPGSFVHLPISNKWWLHKSFIPVRGWIMQQLTKLSAAFATDAELLLYADSDLQLIRPISAESFLTGGAYRFFADPGAMSDGEHLKWHHVASSLLGLPAEYSGWNYNGQLISWRRSHLLGLHERIEQVSGDSWVTTLSKRQTFSEYLLFGNYVDRVVGGAPELYARTNTPLVYSCWTPEQLEDFRTNDDPINTDIVAIHLQSNLGLSNDQEQQLLEERLRVKVPQPL